MSEVLDRSRRFIPERPAGARGTGSRALLSRVGKRSVREQMHRVLVLWEMGYVRESLSQFRLVAEEALRRLLVQVEDGQMHAELDHVLGQGQAARVIERLYREVELVPARIALHLHTLLAWGNYASHHQKLGHHAQGSDLHVLISVAVDLEDWLAVKVEGKASIYDAEDLAWTVHQAEMRTVGGGLSAEVACAFVRGCGSSIQAEAHRLVAPALGIELYWSLPLAAPIAAPYRGLQAFDPEDAGRFYGRRRLGGRLEQTVDTRRLTVVSGASGAGKTSLLRAALIPGLLELGCGVLFIGEYGAEALETARGLLSVWPLSPPLVLILDQYERALMPDLPPAVRAGLLSMLLEVGTEQQGRRAVVGIREDFLGRLLRESQGLAGGGEAALAPLREEDALITVGPLDEQETREAMLTPLEGTGVSFDEELVQQVLLPQLTEMTGTIPTKLQIVCGRLYAEAAGRGAPLVDRQMYESLGGAERILGTHLDQTLGGAAYGGKRDLARSLLKAMTGVDARRWVELGELWQSVTAGQLAQGRPGAPPPEQTLDEVLLGSVLARLIDDRLVVSRGGVGSPARYSLMHDQLIHAVQQWTSPQETEIRQAQQALSHALEAWSDPSRREPLGGRALRLVETHWPHLSRGEQPEAAARLLAASRRARRTERIGIGLLLLLALLGLGFGVVQLKRAVSERDRAVQVADRGVLLRAQLELGRDPTLAVAWLRNLSLGRSGIGVLTLIEEARRQGVASVLQGHEHLVTSLAYSADGRLLASSSRDRTVRLWDPPGHRPGAVLRGHTDYVSCVAIAPNGRTLASASWDGTLRLWDAASGRSLAVLRGDDVWVHWVSFSPDGKRLVAGDARGRLHRWDVARRRRIGPPIQAHSRDVLVLAHSPDGRILASASLDQTIRLWRAGTGEQIAPALVGHRQGVYALAFRPDGKALASGDRGGELYLWDLSQPGRTLIPPWRAHAEGVLSAAFAPDGETLATSGADKLVRLWDLQGHAVGPPLRGHLGLVHHLVFSPDGKTLASGSRDHTIRLWDIAARRKGGLRLRAHRQPVQSVAFAPDGRSFASASRDGTVRLWDTRQRVEQEPPLRQGAAALVVAFSPDGRWLASGGDLGRVLVWARGQGRLPVVIETGAREVLGLAFHPRSPLLASAGSDGRVQLWELPSGSLRGHPLTGHTDAVYAVTFSPDGTVLYSGGRDRTVRAWALAPGRRPAFQTMPGGGEAVYALAISPDGRTLAAGRGDATIQLWNLGPHPSAGARLRGHRHWVLALAFSPDGRRLASGSSDGTVQLWTGGSAWGPPLRGHTDWVQSVAFSPDGKTLASASADHTVWLWQLSGPTSLTSLRRLIDDLTNVYVGLDGRVGAPPP